jgi:hypothetical protein
MKMRNVSKELDMRVSKWFEYLSKNNQTMDEHEILGNLPDKLRISICDYNYLEKLKKVNIFSDCEENFLRELSTKLSIEVYSPGEFVCRKGDIGKEMFIILKGSLNVVSDDGTKVFVTLKKGSFFGEISILNIPGNIIGNRRTANVKALGYTDLLRLTKKDLWETLIDYPADKKILIEKGKDKLKKDNLLDETQVTNKRSSPVLFPNLDEKDCNVYDEINKIPFKNCSSEDKMKLLFILADCIDKKIDNLFEDLTEKSEFIKKKMEIIQKVYNSDN